MKLDKQGKVIFITKVISIVGFLFFSTLIIFVFLQPPETGVGLFIMIMALIASSGITILFINRNQDSIYEFVISKDIRYLKNIIIGSKK